MSGGVRGGRPPVAALKLMVTGGSGFLGGHVLREAARRGHTVVALARSEAAAAAVAALGARPAGGDLDDPVSLAKGFAAAKCDVLVDLASLGFDHEPAIAAAERSAIARAVFVSTKVVKTSLPAACERVRPAAEQRIRASDLNWTILRPTVIYGDPGDRNLSRLLPLLPRAPILPVHGAAHSQQPVQAADVADAVLAAAERPAAAGHVCDVAGPAPLTFTELLRTAADAVASRTRFVPVPLPPVVAAGRGYELLNKSPKIRVEQLRRLVIATPHDSHAELTALALKDGRHVRCEKPVALSTEELAEVQATWEASERQLVIGFNRRSSPAMLTARKVLAGIAAPKFLVYRVAAGPVPDDHWYTDRRQGGRILGEVRHFVDTAQALIGADIEQTASVLAADAHGRSGGDGRVVPGNDAAVSLRLPTRTMLATMRATVQAAAGI